VLPTPGQGWQPPSGEAAAAMRMQESTLNPASRTKFKIQLRAVTGAGTIGSFGSIRSHCTLTTAICYKGL